MKRSNFPCCSGFISSLNIFIMALVSSCVKLMPSFLPCLNGEEEREHFIAAFSLSYVGKIVYKSCLAWVEPLRDV